jgi:hypothetical protein
LDPKILDGLTLFGLLAILIWRLPNIIAEFTNGIKYIMDNVRAVQNEALASFERQFKQLNDERAVHDAQELESYQVMQETLKQIGASLVASNNQLTRVIEHQEDMRDRLTRLEAKS